MIRITPISDAGDARGESYAATLPRGRFGARGIGVHATTVRPAAIRGNHYHAERFEVLLIHHDGPWSLHWDTGEGTAVHRHAFAGRGLVHVEIEPLASHAVRNDGDCDLWIVALTDGDFDPDHPDVHRRAVV